MAGHSKWANIKHRKGRQDAKRSKLWSKIARMIIVAAKAGGGDPGSNLTLRYAIDEAKAANMPKDTIKNAIKKGTGELGGNNYEEAVYEGYGPAGVAFMITALTDNRNRTGPEMRVLFDRAGGQLGATNCVAYMFEQKGVITVATDAVEEDVIMEIALEAGAEDVTAEGDVYEITCDVASYVAVSDALAEKEIEPASSELTRVAANLVTPEPDKAQKVLNLIEQFEDNDDVQKVFTNLELTDELMKQLEEEG